MMTFVATPNTNRITLPIKPRIDQHALKKELTSCSGKLSSKILTSTTAIHVMVNPVIQFPIDSFPAIPGCFSRSRWIVPSRVNESPMTPVIKKMGRALAFEEGQ